LRQRIKVLSGRVDEGIEVILIFKNEDFACILGGKLELAVDKFVFFELNRIDSTPRRPLSDKFGLIMSDCEELFLIALNFFRKWDFVKFMIEEMEALIDRLVRILYFEVSFGMDVLSQMLDQRKQALLPLHLQQVLFFERLRLLLLICRWFLLLALDWNWFGFGQQVPVES
jgi:hypothetical protein